MAGITKDITAASREPYDLIVIGGGIHGVMIAFEASIRNLKTLLVEKKDFGAATSYNSLRILHGGFRYLQSFDLRRLFDSANERKWFLKYFPEIASPQPCLMPLYGKGLRHPAFLGPALKAYDILTHHRNAGMADHQRVPNGRLLNPDETLIQCRFIRKQQLKGGALWYDGFIPDSQRVLIGVLRWACEYGLNALNYVRAIDLLQKNNTTIGVLTRDEESGEEFICHGHLVINAAGPWCREVAFRFDRDEPSLFRSMMAYNILFNRPAISSCAVAASPPGPTPHTYFVVPWKGMMFAGTGQAPWPSRGKKPLPTDAELQNFCLDLNRALPGINITMDDILHVFAGLQSAKFEGGTDFSKREVIIDHSINGGPKGFYSVSGIKFTTARKVAEKLIDKLIPQLSNPKIPHHLRCPPPKDATTTASDNYAFDWTPREGDTEWMAALLDIAREEAVIHLDDLVVRRTSLGDNPLRAMAMARDLCRLMGWDNSRTVTEINRLATHFSWAPTTRAYSEHKIIT